MDCRPRPEGGGAAARLALVLLSVLLAAGPVRADERVLFGGLLDAEYWQTDDASLLLARNGGDAAPGGRLYLWSVASFLPGLQGFAMGEAYGGKAYGDETEYELDLAYVRATFKPSWGLVAEAGRILTPVGNFPARRLSSRNPLVGTPDSYSVSYPLGVQLTGRATERFDWRVAFVDGPLANENYIPPDPGSSFRPALALGWTPLTGLRLGAYATKGTYLGPDSGPYLNPGESWKDFQQSIYGFDLRFSRGYFELNGDFARSSYDAPGAAQRARGIAWFIEPKYTFSPRLFAALRLERNDYPYIQPLAPGFWLAVNADLFDAEASVGFRIGPDTLVKAAYRRDYWRTDNPAFFPDGHSFSVQLSHTFSVNSWVERPR